MIRQHPSRGGYDLSWRRSDLGAVMVLAVAGGLLLVARAADRPYALGLAPAGIASRAAAAAELIDPNLASSDSLERLPRIGPVLARAIVTARESDAGPFKDLDDLRLRVKGIGPVTAERLAPFLTFRPDGS